MPVSAEGRVEHQKQNQKATSQWPVGFVFGVQLDYSCRKKSDPANAKNRVVLVSSQFKLVTSPFSLVTNHISLVSSQFQLVTSQLPQVTSQLQR